MVKTLSLSIIIAMTLTLSLSAAADPVPAYLRQDRYDNTIYHTGELYRLYPNQYVESEDYNMLVNHILILEREQAVLQAQIRTLQSKEITLRKF